MRRRALLAPALATALTLAGCAGSSHAQGTQSGKPTGTLTVFAAASLTDVFPDLGRELEKQDPGLHVRFNFGGSSQLATQIAQGAPADVFASADQRQMTVVTDAHLQAGDPQTFAENVLEIAVPPANPGHVTGLADFAKPDLKLAVCAPQVPCGAAAQRVFAAAGIDARPDTQEEDVRAALTKVELGEVDAALVYSTDVRAAGGKVRGIPFPEAGQAVNRYLVCALQAAGNPRAAEAFVRLVLSPTGQAALEKAGFRKPAP